jgi:hypothetical protein
MFSSLPPNTTCPVIPSVQPRYTRLVYARKLRVDVLAGAERRPCPLDWLDNFCMRDFTGQAEFDDTLPIADGLLEAGFRVQPERLAGAMSAWFTRRGKGDSGPVRIEIYPA